MERFHPIGTPGTPWTDEDRRSWFETCSIRRSYAEEVLARLEGLPDGLAVEQYGALSHDPERYPLHCVRSARPVEGAPWVLITGGVHLSLIHI